MTSCTRDTSRVGLTSETSGSPPPPSPPRSLSVGLQGGRSPQPQNGHSGSNHCVSLIRGSMTSNEGLHWHKTVLGVDRSPAPSLGTRAASTFTTHSHTPTHTYTYIHTYTHTETHTYTYIHTCTHIHIHMHTQRHTYTHTHTHINTHILTHTERHTYAHTHMHAHTRHIHADVYTHTYMHARTHAQGPRGCQSLHRPLGMQLMNLCSL